MRKAGGSAARIVRVDKSCDNDTLRQKAAKVILVFDRMKHYLFGVVNSYLKEPPCEIFRNINICAQLINIATLMPAPKNPICPISCLYSSKDTVINFTMLLGQLQY